MLSELFHINLRFCSFFLYTSKIQIILCKIFHIKSHNFYINKFFSYCTFLKLTNYYAKEVTLLSHISQIRVLYISIFFFNFFAIIFSTWKIDIKFLSYLWLFNFTILVSDFCTVCFASKHSINIFIILLTFKLTFPISDFN